jgi:hypothetical protein
VAFEDDIATLTRAPVFHLMHNDALRLFAFAGEHRTLRAGEVLFHEGDKCDGGFVVMRGAIVVAPPDRREAFVAEPGALNRTDSAVLSYGPPGDCNRARIFDGIAHLADADAPRASGVSLLREGRSSCPLDRTVNAVRGARTRSAAAPQHRAIYVPRGQ